MSHRSNPFRKLKSALRRHSATHAAPSGPRHAGNPRTSGWDTFEGWLQPETKQDAPSEPPAQVPALSASATLPPLPPGSMAQRESGHYRPMPPVTHNYRGGLVADADLFNVADRVKAALRPAFQLNANAPLFRDDTTLKQYEDLRQARISRMQALLTQGRRDMHGENLGTGQGPKTLIMSPVLCERFGGNTGTMPAVKR